MKIAVVHSFYSSRQPSGENAVVVDQVAALRSAGHEVLLVDRYTDDWVESRSYPLRAAATTATGWGPSPVEALDQFEPDIVHVHNTFPNWGTRWLRGEWSNRTVTTLHNYRSVCANGLLFRDGGACSDCLETPVLPALRHRCYRDSRAATLPLALGSAPRGGLRKVPSLSARLVALNTSAQAVFAEVFGREVDVIPNFVSGRPNCDRPSLRWLYVGRLSEEKGIDVLIQSWPEEEPLDVVGDGPLLSQLKDLGRTKPAIRFLGMLGRDEVQERLPNYTGLVLPSMCRENLPTVVLEALAGGVPALMSHHVQAAEHLQRQGAAMIFRPEGGVEEVRAGLQALDRAGVRARDAARQVHRAQYSEEVWLQAMERIYGEVVQAHG